MNVFDGHSTASPATSAKASAAIAPPAHDAIATAPAPFQDAHAASKRRVISPSDHCSESMTSSHSACRRARSRRSKPMAKREGAGTATSKAALKLPLAAAGRSTSRRCLDKPEDSLEDKRTADHRQTADGERPCVRADPGL